MAAHPRSRAARRHRDSVRATRRKRRAEQRLDKLPVGVDNELVVLPRFRVMVPMTIGEEFRKQGRDLLIDAVRRHSELQFEVAIKDPGLVVVVELEATSETKARDSAVHWLQRCIEKSRGIRWTGIYRPAVEVQRV